MRFSPKLFGATAVKGALRLSLRGLIADRSIKRDEPTHYLAHSTIAALLTGQPR
jgi:hypothetical protein